MLLEIHIPIEFLTRLFMVEVCLIRAGTKHKKEGLHLQQPHSLKLTFAETKFKVLTLFKYTQYQCMNMNSHLTSLRKKSI